MLLPDPTTGWLHRQAGGSGLFFQSFYPCSKEAFYLFPVLQECSGERA